MTAACWGSCRVLSALREPGTHADGTQAGKWACKACLRQTLLATIPSFLIFISFYFSQTSPSVVAMGTFLELEKYSHGNPPRRGQVGPFPGVLEGLRRPSPARPYPGLARDAQRKPRNQARVTSPTSRWPGSSGRQGTVSNVQPLGKRPCCGERTLRAWLVAFGATAGVCTHTNPSSCSPVWDVALVVAKPTS